MTVQKIVTPEGETLVVLPLVEYERLREAADDLESIAAGDKARAEIAAGRDELVPSAMLDCLLDGENAVRVWRQHRGMNARELAAAAGLSAAYLSEIETGRKAPGLAALRKLAAALRVDLDDLAG